MSLDVAISGAWVAASRVRVADGEAQHQTSVAATLWCNDGARHRTQPAHKTYALFYEEEKGNASLYGEKGNALFYGEKGNWKSWYY